MVDDELFCCSCCNMVIRQLGMECDYVCSGEEALQLFQERKTDYFAVFVDWHMPKEDGVSLCRTIREIDADIPLILMSEQDWETIEYEARKAGATSFMLKPLFPTSVVACLQQYIDEMPLFWKKQG